MSPRSLLAAIVLGAMLLAGLAGATPEDRAALVAGVDAVSGPCCTGSLLTLGEGAFPVVLGGEHEYRLPVVAAAHANRGRVVAFAHPGYFAQALTFPSGQHLVLHALAWASGKPVTRELRVGVRGAPELEAFLRDRVQVRSLDQPGSATRLDDLDVVCAAPSSVSGPEQRALLRFVWSGGGALLAEKAGDWLAQHPTAMLPDYPGNRMFKSCGLLWLDGDLGKPDGAADISDPARAEQCRPEPALALLTAVTQGKAEPSRQELGQALLTVTQAARALPIDDFHFRPQISRFLAGRRADFAHLRDQPVTLDDVRGRVLLAVEVQEARRLPAWRVRAHPSAASFPGAVPANAPRVTRTVPVDTAVPGWHGTGLYAAPGEMIEATVPARAAGKGLAVRIGAHTDTLWHLDTWHRAPEISRACPLQAPRTLAANAFGGSIYVDVPEGCGLGVVTVTVSHAVEAPRYVRGVTPAAEWRDAIRLRPAPWAEIEGRNLILTVPSDVVRTLEDPEVVAKFWDDVLDAQADLAGLPRTRLRPERICTDEQISAGYMHSGYPIMTFLDVTKLVLSPTQMASDLQGGGAWGFFHELGHNHQSADYDFEGTTEVTCNLFTLYVYETVCHVPAEKTREQTAPEWRNQATREYLAKGARFADWQADPFLGLILYLQLKEGFGWETYRRVFAEYRALPVEQRPTTDDERRDQWLVRFSRAAGKNLGPFLAAWGIPTSASARASVAELPVWMPPDFPPQ